MKKILKRLFVFVLIFSFFYFIKKMEVTEGIFSNIWFLLFLSFLFTLFILWVEDKQRKNYDTQPFNYDNLDMIRYLLSIIVIIVHLRPFLGQNTPLDVLFNNILGRICVPFFFLVTGYFVAQKEKNNSNYIKHYIKSTIPTYLVWSVLYLPALFLLVGEYLPQISEYLVRFSISSEMIIPLSILATPIFFVITLFYSGTYYHLWYFPALLLSLFVLDKWKKKFSVKSLLVLSFFLLILGATETYYGAFPSDWKVLLNYYFSIFFTTRNFLFFGLFYVVFGYCLGIQKKHYVHNSFLKLLLCCFLLLIEGLFLQTIERLNSNILISCIPLIYYLFTTLLYSNTLWKWKRKYSFRGLYKYYYFVHPYIILLVNKMISLTNFKVENQVFLLTMLVIILTHLTSLGILKIKQRHPKWNI